MRLVQAINPCSDATQWVKAQIAQVPPCSKALFPLWALLKIFRSKGLQTLRKRGYFYLTLGLMYRLL